MVIVVNNKLAQRSNELILLSITIPQFLPIPGGIPSCLFLLIITQNHILIPTEKMHDMYTVHPPHLTHIITLLK